MFSLMTGTVVGLVLTVALYLVPGINIFSPLLGGLAGGAIARRGVEGGLAVGALMTIAMLLPGVLLAYFVVGPLLSSIALIGTFATEATIAIWITLITHTAALGFAGAAIGGAIAGRKRVG